MRLLRCAEGGLAVRALTGPTLAHTYDEERAASSRWEWRVCDLHPHGNLIPCYRLTPLGVLHRVTGLTLDVGVREAPITARERVGDALVWSICRVSAVADVMVARVRGLDRG